MKRIFILLILMAIASGCSRYIESSDPGFDLPTAPPVPTPLNVSHMTNGVELSWEISDTDAVDYYKVFYGSEEDVNLLVDWDTTSEFSSIITGLNPGQVYRFSVSSVTPEKLEGARAEAVATTVGVVSMIINKDDSLTKSKNVSITFVLPTTAYLVQLSEDAAFTGTNWENFSTTKSFTLSDGDELKRVYGRFQFSDGSGSSGTIGDSITLDTYVHIDSAYFRPLTTGFEAEDTLTFYIEASESGGEASVSFPGVSSLDLFDDGTNGDVTADDGLYTREYIIPIDMEIENGVVSGSFKDAAGNIADSYLSTSLLTIENPPLPVSLYAVAENSATIKVSWSESGDDDFAAYRLFRDTVWNVSSSSTQIAYIESRGTTSHTDDNLDADRTYHYRIYVYDDNGLLSPSEIVDVTTPVNVAPKAVILAAQSDAGTVTLSWTESIDDDFDSYRIYRSGSSGVDETDELVGVINNPATTNFEDTPAGASFYRVFVYDGQGLFSGSNEVTGP